MMQRSPLQEIPLSRVPLPPTPRTTIKSNKRPLSPDGPSPLIPAKRRILSEDGILSSEKLLKSPFHIRDNIPFRILEEAVEPSPAKKLDFNAATVARSAVGDQHSRPPSVAPSPRTPHTQSTPKPRSTPATDDFFATPERLPSSRIQNPPRLEPRPLPECSDPHSVHYPGFRVHRDPYIVVTDPIDIESFVVKAAKENLRPRSGLKKAATAPACVDSILGLTPDSKKKELERIFKAKSTPATPKKTAGKERLEHTSPTPQRPGVSLGARPWIGTPSLTDADKRERRRLMMEEAEVGCNEGAFPDI
ncbi:hypothetical protein V5O48_014356 [Marasmius crinis-equi]|uniref:Uncharacterized protein n=1 Tax=Marasmius crinis-equi TaxID=585013 RepID=A0ABR3EXL7_9AGAR